MKPKIEYLISPKHFQQTARDQEQKQAAINKEIRWILIKHYSWDCNKYFIQSLHNDEIRLRIVRIANVICILSNVIIFKKMINIVEMVLLVVYVKVAMLCSVGKGSLLTTVYCSEMLSYHENYQENERNCCYQSVVIYNCYSTYCKSSLDSSLV
jgi:hypothetical protein